MVLKVSSSGKKTYGHYVTLSPKARAMGTEARQQKAKERASDLAPVMADLQASGVTSLSGIAAAGQDWPMHEPLPSPLI